jgi:hypothetical protein
MKWICIDARSFQADPNCYLSNSPQVSNIHCAIIYSEKLIKPCQSCTCNCDMLLALPSERVTAEKFTHLRYVYIQQFITQIRSLSSFSFTFSSVDINLSRSPAVISNTTGDPAVVSSLRKQENGTKDITVRSQRQDQLGLSNLRQLLRGYRQVKTPIEIAKSGGRQRARAKSGSEFGVPCIHGL